MARSEEGVVDPRRDDADAVGVRPVERGDLLGLDRARSQNGVGAVDDGRLGLGPAVGHVGFDLFGHRLGLDPVQRVEGADQREVELVLDDVTGEPREPVVGVHRGEGDRRSSSASRSSTPWVNAPTTSGSVSLGRTSSGPAGMWWTRNPGSTWTTGGRSGDHDLVKTSQAAPDRARAVVSSRT